MATPAFPADLPSHFQVRLQWTARHQWANGQTLAQIFHGCYSVWLVEAGTLHAESATNHFRLGPGDALLWPPDLHRVIRAGNGQDESPGARWLTVGIQARLFGHLDILPLLPAPHRWQPTQADYHHLNTLMTNIIDAPGTASGALLRDGLCRALVASLWQSLREDDLLAAARQTLPDWLQKVLALAHSQPECSVADLARAAAFSPAQFRRAFARWMQQSPRDYLQNQRLELARKLLENSSLPISTIAAQLHFAGATHFGRAWKKRNGISPAAYRKQAQSAHLNL